MQWNEVAEYNLALRKDNYLWILIILSERTNTKVYVPLGTKTNQLDQNRNRQNVTYDISYFFILLI